MLIRLGVETYIGERGNWKEVMQGLWAELGFTFTSLRSHRTAHVIDVRDSYKDDVRVYVEALKRSSIVTSELAFVGSRYVFRTPYGTFDL